MSINLPKISIVMPVLNRENLFEKALLSVIQQNYPRVEIIVIDGGSTDKTIDIIKRHAEHISYWQSEPDRGAAVAVNLGIAKASGDLVALLMADDWYEQETLMQVAQAFMQQPDVDIVTCGGRIVYFDNKTQQYKTQMSYLTANELQLNFSNICFATSAICCRFIKKSFYQRIGLYKPFDSQGQYMYTNDKEFLLRAVLSGVKTKFVNYIGHNYLASPYSSTFGNHQSIKLRLCHEHMEIAENFLSKNKMSSRQQFLLKYWYNDQLTRLVLFNLLQGDFKQTSFYAKQGIIKYKLWWLLAFVYTTGKIVIKKLKKFFEIGVRP